jgi:demethylmenaquinone methyltransferase/2-methoxy-6-polyprenyl-1,4-benzoquinol methylase
MVGDDIVNTDLMSTRTRHARALFAGIAAQYEWMGAALSFGQDPRWRRFLVSRIAAPRGSGVLDVASGTGLVARALERRGYHVIALDPSEAMLRTGADKRARVLARAEALPFADATFDGLTFTYLLRYVDDPATTLGELVRVVRRGAPVASLEFYVPEAEWAATAWRAYTRRVMPFLGSLVSPAWAHTGRFLGPSIEQHWRAHPLEEQLGWWNDAGVAEVRARTMSNGAAIVTWGIRR